MRPRPLLWLSMTLFAAAFSWLSAMRHRSFETGRFDLGNMVQAVWTTAHGHPLRMTSLEGDQMSRLGAHFDPILVVFAPLWRLWPSAGMLTTVQAAAIALGALPVFLLARRHLGSERAALGFAVAYLLYPPVEWLARDEFHPVALACPLLLFAVLYLDDDRLAPFAACAAAAVLTKEEVGLVVAGLGAWYALSRGRYRTGAAIMAAGGGAAALAVLVVVPHFNSGHGSTFYGRYDAIGPTTAWHPVYLLSLLLPLAGLSLLAPLLALAALPELALNLLSSAPTQSSIHFHYTAAEIPVLVAAAVLGARRLGRSGTVALALVATTLVANYLLGPIPQWRYLPGGATLQADTYRVSRRDRVSQRAVDLVPDGVVVSADNSLGAHLSARRRVLSFPYVLDATWVAVDVRKAGYADRIAPQATAFGVAALRHNPAWKVVFDEDGIVVLRRVLPA